MNTRYKIVTGAAALTLAGGAAVAVPNLAQAETSTPSAPSTSSSTGSAAAPVSPMKAGLDKLVKAGTITQAQADKVLAQIEADRPQPGKGPGGHGGPGGPGAHGRHGGPKELAAAAKVLGLTEAQLRTKLATQTLAQIADAQKVSRQAVTDALTKAMTADAATRAKEMLSMTFKDHGPADGRGPAGQGGPQAPRPDGQQPGAPAQGGQAPSGTPSGPAPSSPSGTSSPSGSSASSTL